MNELLIEVAGGLIVGTSLGLVGAGGAILSVPIFAVLLGHESKDAVAEALVVTCAIALFSAARAAIVRTVDWLKVVLVGAPGMLGAAIGGWGAHWLGDTVQMGLFAAVALVAAWRMAAAPVGAANAAHPASHARRSATEAALVGLAIGILTGLVGVGGGFLLVPALVLLLRVPMRLAVGTSLAIITLNSAVGFLASRMGDPRDVHPDWQAVIVVILCGVVGSLAGARLAAHLPQVTLRRVFAALLVVVAVLTVVQQVRK